MTASRSIGCRRLFQVFFGDVFQRLPAFADQDCRFSACLGVQSQFTNSNESRFGESPELQEFGRDW